MKFLLPISSRYGAILIQFLLVTLIARELDTDSAGVYFFISGLVLSLYFIAGLGLPDGIVAACPPQIAMGALDKARAVLDRSLLFSIPSAVIVPIALGALVSALYGSLTITVSSGLWLLGYCLIFIASQNLIALGRIQSGAFIFYSSVNLCLCFTTIPYLLFSENPSLQETVAINACASMIAGTAAMLFTFVQIHRLGPGGQAPSIRPIWRNGLLMAIGRVVQAAIIWMPVWIAGILLTETDAAQIGLATRLLGVVGAVLAVVRFSVRPQIAQLASVGQWRQIEVLNRKLAFWATALASAAVIGTYLAGDALIPLIFGHEYLPSAVLLLILLGACMAESLGGPVDEILKMSGSARAVLGFQVLSLIFMAIIGVLLSTRFGAPGICAAFALAFVLLYGGQIVFLYRSRRIIALPQIPGAR